MKAHALRIIQTEGDKAKLQTELDACLGVTGCLQKIVKDFLTHNETNQLEEITIEDIKSYHKYVSNIEGITVRQKKYYSNLLERVKYSYHLRKSPLLEKQISELNESSIRYKTAAFLAIIGIADAKEITYDIRSKYKKYLEENMAESKISEYLKALDQLRLNTIKKDNDENPLKLRKLVYNNEKVFLMYHPDYKLAMTFYYIRNKEELMFDFSIPASVKMKMQIFKMLVYILDIKENWHDRRERFLIPLKLFYSYCVEKKIEDIEQLSEQQVHEFKENLEEKVGTKTDVYMQIVDKIRKYLFVSAKTTNWNANTWYLESFTFEEGRVNPAREIKRINFGQIRNEKNRELFKQYIQYQIGVSQKASLQTIRCQYYDINSFLSYLDDKGIVATAVTAEELKQFISSVEDKKIQPEAFNKILIAVARFFGYLIAKKKLNIMPIHFDYYLKRTFSRHNDRAVSNEIQFEILDKLKYFPLHLRLMYLNLWCIGLRVSEVCAIRGDAYYWDGKDAWFKIYQNKMRSEKYVPIPARLYELMKKYIEENHIKADDFIFKNKKGGAYIAGTFCKQFQQQLTNVGIKNYLFKSHDFRHTVATDLYSQGTSIETIRDYLGHKTSDMTRKYLDYQEEMIDRANEEYFKSKENKIAFAIQKKGTNNGK